MLHKIAGIKVLKAQDGLEAIKLYKKDRFKTCCDKFIKLVLMDLSMPVMDGFKATQAIFELAYKFKVGLDACTPMPAGVNTH